ncbi:class I SAM-dependent methyltransferase [Streptomyces sp. AJS327]|uniref:SAM-dependent methyltransferase n=1 Tax=Streptomyces sp. AJS327 TaxID=2545265 RepID=UPI0015DFF471|nr:methyltransferase domain-containing protein [Streptomyces sp. AJS327]MBA0049531.1 class I SAM-dependent methyltransferase [Streptomyces sp. AJS327]QTC09986.1 class I SAM-dependent methyltransferase [Streptomyces sp.]
MRTPNSADGLAERLGITRHQQFRLMLELGVSVGELSESGGSYRLRGKRAKALVGRNGSVLRALIDEQVEYHGSVYRHLPERLRGGELGDYLGEHAGTIAESSRIAESVVAGYVTDTVQEVPGTRVLDLGCGSGVYLRAASRKPGTSGTGLDVQPASVELAQGNLKRWGLTDRFEVRQGDMREAELNGPYDVVLLMNNIYYFAPEERPELFRTLRAALREGGTLVLVSMFHGTSVSALGLDLVLACTQGCYALPRAEDLEPELREAGFGQVRTDQLMAGQSLLGMRAC